MGYELPKKLFFLLKKLSQIALKIRLIQLLRDMKSLLFFCCSISEFFQKNSFKVYLVVTVPRVPNPKLATKSLVKHK